MGKSKFKPYVLNEIEITSAGSEGKSIARNQDKVIMVDYGVPGDIADIRVTSSKKSYSFGRIERIVTPSEDRVSSFCEHFGTCGGCKWQQMSYDAQLKYKQQQVTDAFDRIGKFPYSGMHDIIPSENTTYYRNKLEFTFTDKKWLDSLDKKDTLTPQEHLGLGFHIPGRFDKVLDIHHCYLQPDPSNLLRLEIKKYASENSISFYNPNSQQGHLRNVIFRNNLKGEWMLILSVKYNEKEITEGLLSHLIGKFSQLVSVYYTINDKVNDSLQDLDLLHYYGEPFITEKIGAVEFEIGPTSFFQTNTKQAEVLYQKTKELAALNGSELVFDLYTGVGTIASYVAPFAGKVIGIEYVEAAILDAKKNAQRNGITNTEFFAGDMKDILTSDFVQKHGKPSVVITDPPRAGMHEDVVKRLLEMQPDRIVYVSCNAATQARDIALMQNDYDVTQVQPVDMFPHTHHVENIALLLRKA
jgi:23S rRNA (uracil1939-C5)-methyltransferase